MNVTNYLTDLKSKLFMTDNWNKITLTRQWTSSVPSKAGVYVLREGKEIVYVGETVNLKGKMNDLLDIRHHTI
jgi:excinuclease UvrABC nuclease subunit